MRGRSGWCSRGVVVAAALAVTGPWAVGLAAPAAAQSPRVDEAVPVYSLPTDEQLTLRAGAWDRSVALEQQGKLDEARQLLLLAWGSHSSSYEVTVRLGWLSWSLRELPDAERAYRRAMTLAGAGAEARQGLASTLTLQGYEDLARGQWLDAREAFQQAVHADPTAGDAHRGLALARETRIDPELWLAIVGQDVGPADNYGAALFLHVPFRLLDWLSLRAAYRFTALSVPRSSNGRGRGSRAGWTQNEIYVGAGAGLPQLWLDALAIAVMPDGENTVLGEAARLSVGTRFGVTIDQAALRREAGWNGQFLPMACWRPTPALRMAAGARTTFSGEGTEPSVHAELGLFVHPVELALRGHYGIERWPVSVASPMVLTLDGDVTVGGVFTGMFAIHDEWALGVQAHLERLETAADTGIYGSGAIGVRYSPQF